MRVNIEGFGTLPGIGLLPVRNVDVSETNILRFISFGKRVYDASNGMLITAAYLEKLKKASAKPAPVVKKSEPEVVVKKEPQPYLVPPAETVDTSKVEYVAPKVDVIPDKTGDVIPEEIETPAEEEIPYEIGVDVAPAEDVVVESDAEETATDEVVPSEPAEVVNSDLVYRRPNGKKKNKHRNNNNGGAQ